MLINKGFPANQLEMHFVMVFADQSGGGQNKQKFGHAIALAYIDGKQVQVLEQLPYPRTLKAMVATGYDFKAVHSMSDSIDVWSVTNQDVISKYASGTKFQMSDIK